MFSTKPKSPSQSPGQTVIVREAVPTNSLGTAALVFSVAGIFSCGLLSPVGIVLGFLALLGSPRGHAMLAIFFGLVGVVASFAALAIMGAASH